MHPQKTHKFTPMKNTIKILGVALLSSILFFTACKKDDDKPQNQQQQNQEQEKDMTPGIAVLLGDNSIAFDTMVAKFDDEENPYFFSMVFANKNNPGKFPQMLLGYKFDRDAEMKYAMTHCYLYTSQEKYTELSGCDWQGTIGSIIITDIVDSPLTMSFDCKVTMEDLYEKNIHQSAVTDTLLIRAKNIPFVRGNLRNK